MPGGEQTAPREPHLMRRGPRLVTRGQELRRRGGRLVTRGQRLLTRGRRPMRRARVALAAASVLVLAAALATVVLVRSDDGTPAAAAATTRTATAEVSRRDLVVTEELAGELGYADARELGAQRSGVVTELAAEGSTVRSGKALYAIDLEPTVLLEGSVPAYRALDVDARDGPDVQQLERALVALGHGDDLTVDRDFTVATGAAVQDWEEDLGRDDPDSTVELGDVAFAAGPVRVSGRQVSVGTQVQGGTPVLALTSTRKVVDVDLPADDADLLAAGDAVTLNLPDGRQSPGTVAGVGTRAQTDAADPEADPTVELVVALDRPGDAGDFDSGSVDVIVDRSRDEDVLAVPVTALLALLEGGYAVQVVDSTQATGYRLVPVTAGTIAAEYVEVSGDGMAEGLEVVVPA